MVPSGLESLEFYELFSQIRPFEIVALNSDVFGLGYARAYFFQSEKKLSDTNPFPTPLPLNLNPLKHSLSRP